MSDFEYDQEQIENQRDVDSPEEMSHALILEEATQVVDREMNMNL